MEIILDEVKWCENILKDGNYGKKPSETVCRLAKYYTSLGLSSSDVRSKLEEFILHCDPKTSIVKWDSTLDWAMSIAKKNKMIQIEYIGVTQAELDRINKLEGSHCQRLAFTLLCLSKYIDKVNPVFNHWISYKDSDIMKLANIHENIRVQGTLYASLRDAGLVNFSKRVDSLSIQVLFQSDGDAVIKVTDFRNLGFQYMRHNGGAYINCAECGIVFKDTSTGRGRKKKYCSECANKIKIRQSVNSVMRGRALKLAACG